MKTDTQWFGAFIAELNAILTISSMNSHGIGQGKAAQLPAQAHLTVYAHTRCLCSTGKLPLLLNLVFLTHLTYKGEETKPEKRYSQRKLKTNKMVFFLKNKPSKGYFLQLTMGRLG